MNSPLSIADLFIINESSWLYPVYDIKATIIFCPAGKWETNEKFIVLVDTIGVCGYANTWLCVSKRFLKSTEKIPNACLQCEHALVFFGAALWFENGKLDATNPIKSELCISQYWISL